MRAAVHVVVGLQMANNEKFEIRSLSTNRRSIAARIPLDHGKRRKYFPRSHCHPTRVG